LDGELIIKFFLNKANNFTDDDVAVLLMVMLPVDDRRGSEVGSMEFVGEKICGKLFDVTSILKLLFTKMMELCKQFLVVNTKNSSPLIKFFNSFCNVEITIFLWKSDILELMQDLAELLRIEFSESSKVSPSDPLESSCGKSVPD
jgi:hypothetical protein